MVKIINIVKKQLLKITMFAVLVSITPFVLAKTIPVRVCSLPLPPQTMLDENDEADGFAVHILNAIAKRLNWKLYYKYTPWLRVVANAKNGRCDLMMTVLLRSDYAKFMAFPKESVIDQKNVLIVKRGSGIEFSGDLEAFMRKYFIGIYQDKAVDDHFEKLRNAPWAKLHTVTHPKQAIEMLLLARFDAVIENHLTSVYYLNNLQRVKDVEFLSPPLNITPAYITFPHAGRLSNKHITEFDTAMAEFKDSDEYRKLENIYLGR